MDKCLMMRAHIRPEVYFEEVEEEKKTKRKYKKAT